MREVDKQKKKQCNLSEIRGLLSVLIVAVETSVRAFLAEVQMFYTKARKKGGVVGGC